MTDLTILSDTFKGIVENTATIAGALSLYAGIVYCGSKFNRKRVSNELVEELKEKELTNAEKTKAALEHVKTMKDLEYFIEANNLNALFFRNFVNGHLKADFYQAKECIISYSRKKDIAYTATMPRMMPRAFGYVSKN